MLGAGFSSAERLALSFGIKQDNAFGSGNYLGIELNTSKYNRTIVFSTVDPYFTTNGVSRTVDLYYRTSQALRRPGWQLRTGDHRWADAFGVPFTEFDTVYFGMVESTTHQAGHQHAGRVPGVCQPFGYTSNVHPLTVGWSRDDRDSALAPNSGPLPAPELELGRGGDARYLRANYQYQQYIPLNKQFTVAFNGELGWGKGLGGRPFPVFKNFYGVAWAPCVASSRAPWARAT
jgi:outer membrane protein insertion porin family